VYDAIDMLVVLGNTTEFDRLVRCAADAEPSRAAVLLRLRPCESSLKTRASVCVFVCVRAPGCSQADRSVCVCATLVRVQYLLRWVLANASFDLDRNVSVFETNIRVLGA
jgi:hypothetical protein